MKKLLLLLIILAGFIYFDVFYFQISNDNILVHEEKKNLFNTTLYAVISVDLDTDLDFYYFYLPITCLSWRLINYEPIVLAVTSKLTSSNDLAQKTLEYLRLLKIKIFFIQSVDYYEKMTGMLSRLFIGLLDDNEITDECLLFQTDSDLLPINKNFYQKIDKSDSIKLLDVSSFQSPIGKFKYKNKDYEMFYMCHIGMTKRQWRKIMNLENSNYKFDGKSILRLVEEFYDSSKLRINDQIARGDDVWFMDQSILSVKIANYLKQNKHNRMHIKLSQGIKLDRIWSDKKWLDTFNNKFESINDVHLFHENYIQKLNFLNLLLKRMFSIDQKSILEKYINEFMIIKNSTF